MKTGTTVVAAAWLTGCDGSHRGIFILAPQAQQQPDPGMSRLPPDPLFESNWHEPVAQSRTQPLWSRPFSTKPNSAQAQQQPDPAEARFHMVHHLVTQI
ncbi:hypothetical protein V6N11_052091 [Hibiscus sabdariffa]|uniref:Secreted protein n=1 Tax=Hibiscus sabdariffa TaxID=183260 RepID=A0ABR2U9B9_9ROSI